MAHCVDFYKKIKRDGNFCGLTRQSMRAISLYFDFAAELSDLGLPEEIVYKYLPQSAYLHSYMPALKKDSIIRRSTLDKIVSQISSNKKITSKQLRKWVGVDTFTEEKAFENFSDAGYFAFCRGQKIRGKKIADAISDVPPKWQKMILFNNQSISINELKNRVFNACNSAQYAVLLEVQKAGYADDEYAAFCIALKWAAERLESEKAAKGGA